MHVFSFTFIHEMQDVVPWWTGKFLMLTERRLRACPPVPTILFQFSGTDTLVSKRRQHWGCPSVSGLNSITADGVCPVLGATPPR